MSTTFYNPAFVTLEGGVPQAEAALIAGIEADRMRYGIFRSAPGDRQ
jgi:hypothetical protein